MQASIIVKEGDGGAGGVGGGYVLDVPIRGRENLYLLVGWLFLWIRSGWHGRKGEAEEG